MIMRNRRFCCVMLAALQLAALSACSGSSGSAGDSVSSAAETTTAAPETTDLTTADTTAETTTETTAQTSTSAAETAAQTTASSASAGTAPQQVQNTGSQADYDAAKAAADRLMQAMQAGDADAVIAASNYGLYIELMEENGEAAQTDIEAELREGLSTLAVKDYTVGTGTERADLLQVYLDVVGEVPEDPEDAAQYQAVMQKLPTPKQLYVFPVSVTADTDDSSDEMYVIRTADGWTVDTWLMPEIFGFALRMKVSSANTGAKSLYNAVNAALTDMDSEGTDLSSLNGTHTMRGSELAGLPAPDALPAGSNAYLILKSKAASYDSSLADLDQFSFVIRNGAVNAAAVQKGTIGEKGIFGCCPNHTTWDDILNRNFTIETALAFAQQAQ